MRKLFAMRGNKPAQVSTGSGFNTKDIRTRNIYRSHLQILINNYLSNRQIFQSEPTVPHACCNHDLGVVELRKFRHDETRAAQTCAAETCKQGDAGRSRGLQNEGLRVREDFARMLLSRQNYFRF